MMNMAVNWVNHLHTLLLVGNEGQMICLVDPKKVAYHAGYQYNPTARFTNIATRLPDGSYKNPNEEGIGIECEWGWDQNYNGKIDAPEKELNDWQLEAIKIITDQYKDVCVLNNQNMMTHSDIASYKSDNLSKDIERFYALYPLTVAKPPVPEVISKEMTYGATDIQTAGQVSKLQLFLREFGFFDYPYITGGFYGVTQASLRAFQKMYNIPTTGKTDVETRRLINSFLSS
jgi:N-acetyl-anhydromuramyl-L-alanine amidase AmpD